MSFLKIIFLFVIFISNSHSSSWDRAQSNLVIMSSHACLLDELAKMEGNELTKDQRIEILRNYFSGFGTKTRQQIGLDLNTKDYLHFDHFVNKWQRAFNLWHEVDMGVILESGIIPMPSEYKHNSRDRRWTAGWLFDTIEIVRQQDYTKQLFEAPYNDINNNDLLKVRELSGTFWKWDGNPRNIGSAIESFSGMIQPSQKITDNPHDLKATVRIISSFNGLWNEDFDQIYFLPKGETPTVGNFFKVMSVKVGDGRFLTQDEANSLSEKWNEEEWGELFQEDSFAIIKVRNLAADGTNTLRKFLHDNNLLNGNQVITLQGDFDNNFIPNRIFAFGKPSSNLKMDSFDENGFCLVSDTGDEKTVENLGDRLEEKNAPIYLVEPLRKLKDSSKVYDQMAKTDPVASKITPLKESVQVAPIPLVTGMNGGPVLICKASESTPFQIKCRLIGVVHGSGLIQESTDKVSYKGLISMSPYLLKPFFADSWKDIHNNLIQMSWESNWLDALRLMEVPQGSPHELTKAQRTTVLERFVRGRGKTPGFSLVDDLAQTDFNVGVQTAVDLDPIKFLDNFIYPTVNMKKALEFGILRIPYRDRRSAAGNIFSAMNIIRQQYYTNPLFDISGDNPHKNDLAVIRALSGTFWNWNRNTQSFIRAKEQFSGMVQTSQQINGATVNVLSCVHGIEKEELDNIYFLPKGKNPEPGNLFQVKSFQIGSDKEPNLTSTIGVDSSKNDYAIIQVNNEAVQGSHTLKGFLLSEGLLNGNSVISLQGEMISDFEPDRVFAFGKPDSKFLKNVSSDEHGFYLTVDTFDGNMVKTIKDGQAHSGISKEPLLRKLKDPKEIYQITPEPITEPTTHSPRPLKATQHAIPIYCYPGMSGGPIVGCKIDDASRSPEIKCQHLGVVSAALLTRENGDKIFYRKVIALPEPNHGKP